MAVDIRLVDVEQLLTGFLRDQDEIAALVSGRVYANLPTDRVYPLIVLSRTGGAPRMQPTWLDEAEITAAFLAKRQKDAWSLMATALSCLTLRVTGRWPQGAVTSLEITNLTYDPYPDATDPAGLGLPRYLATLAVITHP